MKRIRLEDETHRRLKEEAARQGLPMERLLDIIINIALLGIPAILRKYNEAQKGKKP